MRLLFWVTNMNILLNASSDNVGSYFESFFSSIKHSFYNFSIIDAIDILLLSVILFLAYRFFRSKKASALMVGVVIILLISYLSSIFGLEATHFVFSAVIKMGVVALVIIFQPEIRDALEKVGNGSLNGIKTLGEQKKKKQINITVVDQVCQAVNYLSGSKTGALIVISRTIKLDEITETGII